MLLAGEDCNEKSRGMYLVKTNFKSPFAKGRIGEIGTRREWQDGEAKLQSETLKVFQETIENGNFPQDLKDTDSEGYASVLENLDGLNRRLPKVLSINRT